MQVYKEGYYSLIKKYHKKESVMKNCIKLLTIIVLTLLGTSQCQCLLCREGLNGLKNPNFNVDKSGKTCAELTVEIYNLDEKSRTCLQAVSKHRYNCCLNRNPPQSNKPIEQHIVKTGPYNQCNLCRNGMAPRIKSMVINMLYLGPGSCHQYYMNGLRGNIPDQLCSSLQFFANEPCGCLVGTL